jgi:hypothetical protein
MLGDTMKLPVLLVFAAAAAGLGCTPEPKVPTPVGTLSPDAIRDAIYEHNGTFRACYGDGLAKNPNLRAWIHTRFVIGETGSIVEMELEDSSAPEDVTSCILNELATVKFPPPQGGFVTVRYPLQLRWGPYRPMPEPEWPGPTPIVLSQNE